MSLPELLRDLVAHEVQLRLDGERVLCQPKPGDLPLVLANALREHKPGLAWLLQTPQRRLEATARAQRQHALDAIEWAFEHGGEIAPAVHAALVTDWATVPLASDWEWWDRRLGQALVILRAGVGAAKTAGQTPAVTAEGCK